MQNLRSRSVWHPVRPDRLFVTSRSAALRPEPPGPVAAGRDVFSALAEQEINVHVVVIIANELDLSVVQERILEKV